MPERLQFDASTHQYKLDGQIVPSVTQVLRDVGIIDFSMIPQDVLQEAAARGTFIHKCFDVMDTGELDRSTVPDEWMGYIDAYSSFKRESDWLPSEIERRVFNDAYRYAGTMDRVGFMGGDPMALDFKTGIYMLGYELQLAGYTMCLPQPLRFRRAALIVRPDGTYRLHEYPIADLARSFVIFSGALACCNFKANNQGGN